MKKYVIINLVIITGLVAYLAINASIKPVDERITVFNSSISFESNGNLDSAISVIQNNYSKFENDYLYNLRLGWLYYSSGQMEKSLGYYEKAKILVPGNIESQFGATLPLSKLDKKTELIKVYSDIIKTDSMNYTANLYIGQIYLSSGDYSKAKYHLEKSFNQYPGYFDPNLYLGWTYYYLGNKKKAKDHFIYSLMLVADNKSAMEGLSLVE